MVNLRAAALLARRLIRDPSEAVQTLYSHYSVPDAECPCCGYEGQFRSYGARAGAHCPRCRSLARHRLLALAAKEVFFSLAGKSVLHFAAEPSITRLIEEQRPAQYRRADLNPKKADIVLNMEAIDLPNASVDAVVASHILEHVDDRKAIAEIFRILTPGGQLIAMVPLIEGWDTTYEDASKSSDAERTAHFGQFDHVRFYGADFRERLRAPGFRLAEFTAGGADSVRYRLERGSKVFLATKPA